MAQFIKIYEDKPNEAAIAKVVKINIFLRPILSATKADIGIKRAKNKTENNWINKASLLVKPKSDVAQLNVKTVIK